MRRRDRLRGDGKLTPTRRSIRLFIGFLVLLAAALLEVSSGTAAERHSPDAALARLLGAAHAAVPGACDKPGGGRLVHILCAGRIRIGVRFNYPLFAAIVGGRREGYEIDIARAIARELGVAPVFVTVHAATRIAALAEGEVDLVIATMGHNTERDGQARFIRPHYYRSETIVVGPKALAIHGWPELHGRTVCATVGNGSNAELVAHGVPLMLFDDASLLPDRLEDDTCTLAAQDDSFFASYFAQPGFARRFAAKFGFARVPWGMAVARHGSEDLARVLDLTSQIFHRDGVFLAFARAHRIATAFLVQQQAVWRRPQCDTDTGAQSPACVLPPLEVRLAPTSFAGEVAAFRHWLKAHSGFDPSLPMLMTAPAWSLFLSGIANSLVLVFGTLAATFIFALLFGAALGARSRLLAWPARAFTIALQSSPILLTLVLVSALIHMVFAYSSSCALAAAMLALGLANGANAGQAISEAVATLRLEGAGPAGGGDLFLRALSRSATQIMAFLVNAAKGTPIASFIGAPELLNALTDITSFSSGRVLTYSLLLCFYTAVVMLVVWLCARFRSALERREAAAR